MGQQEVEARGVGVMLSVQPPPQKKDKPKTESEDVVMSHQDTKEVESKDHDMADVQIITRQEFDNPRGSEMAKDLRTASKLQGETSVDEKSDIESLKVKVDFLEHQLEVARIDQQYRARELEDTQTQLATTKQASLEDKEHLGRQNEKIKKLCGDLRVSTNKVGSVRAANRDLRNQLVASQEELIKCRDDLFSLQPQAPVADSRIIEELGIVGEGVIHWIETEVTSYEKAYPEAEEEHIFSVGGDTDAANFLTHHPGAGEHLARYLIHRFFQANLFGRKFNLLGLTEETAKLLQQAERSMANLDPARDSASIAAWRSETLQALAATEECQHIRQKQIREMNDQLFREIGWTFPILSSRRDSMESFYQQVLERAAKVATMIQTSTSTYQYSMPDSPFRNWPPLSLKHMKMGRMLDIKNGNYVKANAAVIADNRGVIGKVIIPLEPGLYRTMKGENETPLRPRTYLVELNHPIVKGSQASA